MRKFSGDCLERDDIFENETAERDDLEMYDLLSPLESRRARESIFLIIISLSNILRDKTENFLV